MGTKNNPGKFDCYSKALPDEPMFTLLARDPSFAQYVRMWAQERLDAIECGERPDSDLPMVEEAFKSCYEAAQWRKENNGKWRKAS